MPIGTPGDQQALAPCQIKQPKPLILGIAPMPHLQTIQSILDQCGDLIVAEQHPVATGIRRVRDDTHPSASRTASTTSKAEGDGVGM